MTHQGVDEQQVKKTLSRIRKKIVVLSGKGGVGKSTVTVGMALCSAAAGKKTGLLDTDLHGPTVVKMLGVENNSVTGDGTVIEPVHLHGNNLKVMSVQFLLQNINDSVIWRGPLKHSVISQFIGLTNWGELDTLFIDSPPGTGDEPLSVVQTAHPDGAVVVTTPQRIATFDVRKSIDFCRKLSLPVLGIIENMSGFVCPHCGTKTDIFSTGGGKNLADDFDLPFLGSLPIEPRMVYFHDEGGAGTGSDDSLVHRDIFNDILEKLNL
jgi:Mrp family chromosome partitioning ATPase